MATRPARYEVLSGKQPGKRRYWWWHLMAANGRILGSSETFRSKAACLNSIRAAQSARGVVVKP